ncbi:hypothetical protein CVT26_003626 [Gymnopilus dilepis]|uniref:Uncharacterized protein n=1 Tax=Gymnopilus dilepis TaxID=231916 RepID=A0A409VR04_9AGAR|nr:hypothetical protein CVT26_003626 [Gymnopilus dilepis]
MKSIIKLFVGALIAMNAVVLALPTTEAAEGCDLANPVGERDFDVAETRCFA